MTDDKLREVFNETRGVFRYKLDSGAMRGWIIERLDVLERNVRAALADTADAPPEESQS